MCHLTGLDRYLMCAKYITILAIRNDEFSFPGICLVEYVVLLFPILVCLTNSLLSMSRLGVLR